MRPPLSHHLEAPSAAIGLPLGLPQGSALAREVSEQRGNFVFSSWRSEFACGLSDGVLSLADTSCARRCSFCTPPPIVAVHLTQTTGGLSICKGKRAPTY
mmetsp:Transcript_4982/g.18641  ORF Transcript_4982/g.18641 Transcript_4982/m.18641 type:complete len:100 (-) Transcript_4982:62-361(-)